MARPSKPWWHKVNGCYRFTHQGKPVDLPGSIGKNDRPQMGGVPRAAWDWMHAWIAARESGRVDPSDPAVEAVCQVYLAWLDAEAAAGRVQPAYLGVVRSHLSKFCGHTPRGSGTALGGRPARSLGPADLEAFARSVRGAGGATHYVANLCRSVQTCFNWACLRVKGRVPERYLADNPVKGYRPPRPPKESSKYLEYDAWRAFVRWAWRRARSATGLRRRFDRLFVLQLRFLMLTGARPGEACALTWAHVRLADGVAVLEEWKNARKTGRAREIHLTPPVVRLLRRVRNAGVHPTHVFAHAVGKGQADRSRPAEGVPWNSAALGQKLRKWRAAAVAEGLPVVAEGAGRLVAYILRHTYISDGLMHGLTGEEVGELTGTSGEMVREVYGHIRREHSARRAAGLAGSRGKAQ